MYEINKRHNEINKIKTFSMYVAMVYLNKL